MTILNVDKELPILIRMVIEHLSDKLGLGVSDLAENINYSKSYIYKLRGNSVDVSVDSRRSFLVRLLKKYLLSISKNDNEQYIVINHHDPSFYLLKCYSYIYDKDSKLLENFYVEIDVVAETIAFYSHEKKRLYAGEYSDVGENTSFMIGNREHIDSFYPGDSDPNGDVSNMVYTSLQCIVSGEIPYLSEIPVFGIFTKRTGSYKMSTGRIILTNYEKKVITDNMLCYLSNEKFHEFYNYEANVKTVDELDRLVKRFTEKYRFINIEVTKELATAYQQFLSFFTDYVDVIKGKEIKFDISKNHNSLTINLELVGDTVQIDEVNMYLKEYIEFVGKEVDTLKINVESNISSDQFDIFLLRLENQINQLKQEIKIAKMSVNFLEKSNKKLESENEFLRGVVEKFSDKQTTILVQMLNGGSHQFADKIDNLQ